uniref:KOW domain-containing protein n=1 Tax=Kalanchoe fedtschenkoi TaxID=63787 RepID=A0A7N0T699_KALFE
MSSKGKGKEVAGNDSYGSKRKRDQDNDKTGGNRKNRAVLQFFDDEAGDAGGHESSDDSIFGNDFFDDLFGSDPEAKEEPVKAQFLPFLPKEEEMSEDELDKMLAERYNSGSGAVRSAEDSNKNIHRSAHIDSTFPSSKDPVIWKVKCAVGRERHSVFCLMQKYVELRALGTKLQIISAISLDHVKGFIFVEAEKQVDLNEACKGLTNIFLSRTSKVATNDISQLLSTRTKSIEISEGTWARVKSGTYKGDIAQVVAVNDARKRATVKLIPRIDLQALAQKFGGGRASKKTSNPTPRLVGLSELDEFRPLIQLRRDRDTDLIFQVLDGLMLKDGYLYKKVPLDSLNFSGVKPSEDEISKFNSSEKGESNDLEWLSQLYGGREKKRPMKSSNVSDKGGGKGEGSSSNPSMPTGYEIYDLVCFGRKDFGIILGFEKDSCKIMKNSPEGPVVVTVDPRQLTTALSDTKFTALDQKKKTLSLGDTVKVVEGPSQGRQGIVKQIYRGIVFLNDENEENDGYFCAMSFMCEKVKLFEDAYQLGEEGASAVVDIPSSPQSHMPRERNREFGRDDKDVPFSVGQTLRIRVGPLKGYLCRVLAMRYSDVTVKLNSQTKILTVKSEHLSEVRKISSIPASDDIISKPSDTLGNLDSSGDWINGAGTSTESNGWNVGGVTTERSGWPTFPVSEVVTAEQSMAGSISSWDNHPEKDATDAGGWGGGTDANQNTAWGGWSSKNHADGKKDNEVSGSTWGQAAEASKDTAGWKNEPATTQSSAWASKGNWGGERSNTEAADQVGWSKKTSDAGQSGWGNKTYDGEQASWGKKLSDGNQDGWAKKTSDGDQGGGGILTSDAVQDGWGKKTSDGEHGGLGKKTSDGDQGGWGKKTSDGEHGGWGKKTSDEDRGGWGKKTSDGHQGGWGSKTSDGDQSGLGSETSHGDQGGWGKKISDGQQAGWSNKTSDRDQGGWGKKTSDEEHGGWGKKTSDEHQGSWGSKTSDGNHSGWGSKISDGQQCGWGEKISDGQQSGWGKKTADRDQSGCGKNTSDEELGGWGKRTSDGHQGGWGIKTSDGNQSGWGSKNSDADQGGCGSKTSDGEHAGWGKKSSDGHQGGLGCKTADGNQRGWGSKTSDGDQGGWGSKTSDGVQGGGGWGKKTSDGDQGGWGKKTSGGDLGGGGWVRKTSEGDQGGESWGKKTSEGDQGGWGKRTSDGDHGGGGWGRKTSSGDEGGGGWGKKTPEGDQGGGSWGKKTFDEGQGGYSNNFSGARGGFERGSFRGRGRFERGGFRGRGSFDRGGRRGGFGGRDQGRDGNGGGWKDGDSFKQRRWSSNDRGGGQDNETSSSNKAGWSKEHGSADVGDSSTVKHTQGGSWSSGGVSLELGSAVNNQSSGWSEWGKGNSASGSKGFDGSSSSQAGNWGRSDEAGGWKMASSTSQGGWSKEPVIGKADGSQPLAQGWNSGSGSSAGASAPNSQSIGWGNRGTGWNKDAGGADA